MISSTRRIMLRPDSRAKGGVDDALVWLQRQYLSLCSEPAGASAIRTLFRKGVFNMHAKMVIPFFCRRQRVAPKNQP